MTGINQKPKEWLNTLTKYNKKTTHQPNNCALLVIDMQNYFLNNQSHAFIPSANTIIPNINNLISIFKEKNIPIIFTRHIQDKNDNNAMQRWWDDQIFEDTEHSLITDKLNTENTTIIKKSKYSAFNDTELNSILKKSNINTVIITGTVTHLCCESTARDAFMNDFNVYFAIDATASYNEDLHLSSLKTLSHGFAIPICTGEIIERIKNL